MTRHETEQLFAGRIDAWRRHDVDALVQVHSENGVLESPIAGTVTGRAAIEGVYRGFLTSFPDLTVENPELVIEDGRVVQLVTFSDTNTGGFMGVPPTGKRFSFPGRAHVHAARRPDRPRKTYLRLHGVPHGNRRAESEACVTMSEAHDVKTPRLQVDDPLGPRVVIIDKPVFRIGRKSESDLRSVGTDISREHAEIIRQDDGHFILKDRGSRCGTFVNDEQVTERTLRHRDKIRLGRSGSAEMVFLADDPSDSRSSHLSGVIDFRPLTTLLDQLRGLGSARVLDEVLVLVMDSAIDATGAERGFIMLANAKGELEFKIARARGKVTLSGKSFATSQKIPQEVFATGRDRIVADLAGRRPGRAASRHGGARHSPRPVHAACGSSATSSNRAPTADQRPLIGVLYLDSRERGQLMSSAARDALEAVAGEAASAIESARLYREATEKARIERELQLAAEIQRALLPEALQSGAAFRRRGRVDPLPLDRRRLFRLLQPAGRAVRVHAGRRRREGPARRTAHRDDSGCVCRTGDIDRLAGRAHGAHQSHADSPCHSVAVRHGHVRRARARRSADLLQRRPQSADAPRAAAACAGWRPAG